MKKVLILAYDFPPYNSIASHRPASWYKYLPDYGISPTVVTLHWDRPITNSANYIIPSFTKSTIEETGNARKIVRVPFRPTIRDWIVFRYGLRRFSVLRRLLTAFYQVTKYLSPIGDGNVEIYRSAVRELDNERYDLIIATGEPFVLFKYAHKLSNRFDIPWVADFRDAWSTNPSIDQQGPIAKTFAKHFYGRLERRYLENTSLITTPSPSYVKHLKRIHRDKTIEVIFNGIEIDNANELFAVDQRTDVFEIAYAGRFYPHQELEMFLEGYKEFIHKSENPNTRAVFYGLNFFPDDINRLRSFDPALNPYLQTTPRIEYRSLLKHLRKANLLLLLSADGIDWLNAKLFDYLPLQRKILLVANDHGILGRIIDDCNAGSKFDSAKEVETALSNLYRQFKNEGPILQTTVQYENYSRKLQAKLLANQIKKITK